MFPSLFHGKEKVLRLSDVVSNTCFVSDFVSVCCSDSNVRHLSLKVGSGESSSRLFGLLSTVAIPLLAKINRIRLSTYDKVNKRKMH